MNKRQIQVADDSGKTRTKEKPRGKPFPKGVSGNYAGGPKHGESWSGIIKRIGDMKPSEASQYLSDIRTKLEQLGDKLTLKEIVVLRAFATLALESNASLMGMLADRAEGKVPNTVAMPGSGQVITWEQFIAGALQASAEMQQEQQDEGEIVEGVVSNG